MLISREKVFPVFVFEPNFASRFALNVRKDAEVPLRIPFTLSPLFPFPLFPKGVCDAYYHLCGFG